MSRIERMRENALDSPRMMAMSKRVMPSADKFLQRVSGGRLSLSAASGIPVAILTTTGRKSGQPRQTAVTYVVLDGDYFIVGSNWTQSFDPAWAYNLDAQPEAILTIKGADTRVKARKIHGDERDALWPRLVELWPLYGYSATKTDRELPVFRLEPSSRE